MCESQVKMSVLECLRNSNHVVSTSTYYLSSGTPGYWNGWWDKHIEGTFQDANDGSNLTSESYQPWYLGEPNGNDQENCGISWSKLDAWNDEGCFKELCGFCHLTKSPVFTLRGRNCADNHDD